MGDPDDDKIVIDEINRPRKISLNFDPLAVDECECSPGAAADPEEFKGQSQIFDRSWAIRRTVGVGLIEAAGFISAGAVGWLTGLGVPAGLLMYAFVRGVMLRRWGWGE